MCVSASYALNSWERPEKQNKTREIWTILLVGITGLNNQESL
jgi:hypothetical protein